MDDSLTSGIKLVELKSRILKIHKKKNQKNINSIIILTNQNIKREGMVG